MQRRRSSLQEKNEMTPINKSVGEYEIAVHSIDGMISIYCLNKRKGRLFTIGADSKTRGHLSVCLVPDDKDKQGRSYLSIMECYFAWDDFRNDWVVGNGKPPDKYIPHFLRKDFIDVSQGPRSNGVITCFQSNLSLSSSDQKTIFSPLTVPYFCADIAALAFVKAQCGPTHNEREVLWTHGIREVSKYVPFAYLIEVAPIKSGEDGVFSAFYNGLTTSTNINLKMGDSERAKQYLDIAHEENKEIAERKRAIKENPNNEKLYMELGKWLAIFNRNDEAVVEYKNAIKLKPNDKYQYAELGELLESMGKTDEAIVEYDNAIKLDPTAGWCHIKRSKLLERVGKTDEAIIAYVSAIKLDPNDENRNIELGELLERVGKKNEAVSEYSNAIFKLKNKQSSKNQDWYIKLGDLLERVDKDQEAIAEYKIGVTFNPKSCLLYRRLGMALETVDKQEAIRAYEIAINIAKDGTSTYWDMSMSTQENYIHSVEADIKRLRMK